MSQEGLDEVLNAAVDALSVAVEKADAAKAAATSDVVITRVKEVIESLRIAQGNLSRVTAIEDSVLELKGRKKDPRTAGMEIRGDNTTKEPPVRRKKKKP
jgi:hypothetical protein